jgi:hypothetical protein
MRGGLDMAGRGVRTRCAGCRVCDVDGNRRGGAELRARSATEPRRRRAMARAERSCRGGPRMDDVRDLHVELRQPELEQPGDAAAEDSSDPDLGPDDRMRRFSGPRKSRDDRDDQRSGDCQAAGRGGNRPSMDAPGGGRGDRGTVRRCRERIVDRSRSLAPEVVGARWRRLWVAVGTGARPERHQLLAGAQPVAREADHVVPRVSLALSCLGLPTFRQPVDALFQRVCAPTAICRPQRAVL